MKVNLSQENRMPVRTSERRKTLSYKRSHSPCLRVGSLVVLQRKPSSHILRYNFLILELYQESVTRAIMTDQWNLKEFAVLFTGNGRENGK